MLGITAFLALEVERVKRIEQYFICNLVVEEVLLSILVLQ